MNEISYTARWKNKKQEQGICRDCPEKALTNRALCEECRIKANRVRAKRYHEKKSAGKCVQPLCTAAAAGGHDRCKKHHDEYTIYMRAWKKADRKKKKEMKNGHAKPAT